MVDSYGAQQVVQHHLTDALPIASGVVWGALMIGGAWGVEADSDCGWVCGHGATALFGHKIKRVARGFRAGRPEVVKKL